MNNPLPPRFRESAFRFYEPIIRSIMSNFPRVIRINPSAYKLAATTFASRLRDAMQSFVDNEWESKIAYDDFLILRDQIVVSMTKDGGVLIGSAESLKAYNNKDAIVDITPPFPVEDSEIQTFDATKIGAMSVYMLASLAASRALAARVRLTNLEPKLMEAVLEEYDIELEEQADGSVILI